ncbi:LysE family translocator [Psychromonas sp. KJ10-10]|uniref:LysE family translocator n=1 Tax=Psychromonas sp. KJ10-10 TaxID=3391823 RepID=UPI0039B638DF
MNEILTFSFVAFILVISPGPNGVLIIKTISANGTKPAIYNILGLFIATFFHGAFSILGLSALVLQSAQLFIVIKIIGALYLLYIGLKAIINTFNKQVASKTKSVINVNTTKNKDFNKSHYFIEGFLTQLLNPKVSMFYLVCLSTIYILRTTFCF